MKLVEIVWVFTVVRLALMEIPLYHMGSKEHFIFGDFQILRCFLLIFQIYLYHANWHHIDEIWSMKADTKIPHLIIISAC